MDQLNQADASDLQKAINDITNPGNPAGNQAAVGADLQAAVNMAPDANMIETNNTGMINSAPASMASTTGVAEAEGEATPVADMMQGGFIANDVSEPVGDLEKIKSSALADLKPIINTIELPAEEKFKLYKEIIESTQDRSCIEPAYGAAKAIADDKERAEALLFIVETINKVSK